METMFNKLYNSEKQIQNFYGEQISRNIHARINWRANQIAKEQMYGLIGMRKISLFAASFTDYSTPLFANLNLY